MRDGVSLTMAPEAFEAAILPLVTKIVTEMIGKNDRPEWLTIDEAAKRIGLLPGAARKRAQRGQLPGAVKDGSRWIVDMREWDAALLAIRMSGNNDKWGERRANGPAPGRGA